MKKDSYVSSTSPERFDLILGYYNTFIYAEQLSAPQDGLYEKKSKEQYQLELTSGILSVLDEFEHYNGLVERGEGLDAKIFDSVSFIRNAADQADISPTYAAGIIKDNIDQLPQYEAALTKQKSPPITNEVGMTLGMTNTLQAQGQGVSLDKTGGNT